MNETLRKTSGSYDKVVIENPSGKHYLGAGLSGRLKVEIDGPAGFYLGTMMHGPDIEVNGNAGWFAADNMTEGKVVIKGSAGDGCGQGMYGGLVIALGDVGNRTGQVMKGGTIVVKGKSEFMTGLYMQGGQIICLGDVGGACGEAIIGGKIYVAGKVRSLGRNAKIDDLAGEERMPLLDVLQSHGLRAYADHGFKKVLPENPRPFYGEKKSLRLRKIGLNYHIEIDSDLCNRCGVCARICPQDVLSAYDREGRKIRKTGDPKSETIQKIVPENKYNCVACMACVDYCGLNAISIHDLPADARVTWKKGIIDQIRVKAATGREIVRGTGPRRKLPDFEDFVIICAQTSRPPIDSYREPCETDVVIGGRYSKDAILQLPMPIMISGMSFGAISKEAKVAIAKAASTLGIPVNTGEGGMISEERMYAKKLIAQYASGRFGISAQYLNAADAIEIKIGQGAKAGMGGLLMAEKVVGEVAETRKIPEGTDAVSPARHMDIVGPEDLKMKIEQLREITGWSKPILVKYSPGRVADDVKIAAKAGADAIVIDGKQGGTGAAPEVALEESGLPTIDAIVQADQALKEIRLRNEIKLIASGGIRTGPDIVKALALGADAVGMATSILVAMGCTVCGLCNTGRCPRGIATQDFELRKRLNVDEAAKRIHNYVSATMKEVRILTQLAGKTHTRNLDKEDLRALTIDASSRTAVKLSGLDHKVSAYSNLAGEDFQ